MALYYYHLPSKSAVSPINSHQWMDRECIRLAVEQTLQFEEIEESTLEMCSKNIMGYNYSVLEKAKGVSTLHEILRGRVMHIEDKGS